DGAGLSRGALGPAAVAWPPGGDAHGRAGRHGSEGHVGLAPTPELSGAADRGAAPDCGVCRRPWYGVAHGQCGMRLCRGRRAPVGNRPAPESGDAPERTSGDRLGHPLLPVAPPTVVPRSAEHRRPAHAERTPHMALTLAMFPAPTD